MNDMLIEKLIDVLDKEADVYGDILKISENKTNVVVEGRVSELESIVKLEQSLVLRLAQLENIREELVEKISAELSVVPSEVTITQLTELLETKESEKLKSCHKKLSGVLNDLKATNQLNTRLIKNSLDYIDFSINIMTNTNILTGNNYGNSGMVGDTGKRSLFDVKL